MAADNILSGLGVLNTISKLLLKSVVEVNSRELPCEEDLPPELPVDDDLPPESPPEEDMESLPAEKQWRKHVVIKNRFQSITTERLPKMKYQSLRTVCVSVRQGNPNLVQNCHSFFHDKLVSCSTSDRALLSALVFYKLLKNTIDLMIMLGQVYLCFI